MACYLYRGIDPSYYAWIAERVRQGSMPNVTFWRESYEPSDNTVRLQVRQEALGYDLVYCVDAAELAAYESAAPASNPRPSERGEIET
ncbi:MAG TPA: hypothetical protein VKC57_13295 [Ktedonobacterales bacterium]|nr:hypothetical protein [Ktedonobacterales bacterium]